MSLEPTVPPEEWLTVDDPVDGTTWRVDVGFLTSGWTCIWDDGCGGIGPEIDAAAGTGCCSVGAQLIDDDEARRIGALGLTLDPDRFQYAGWAAEHGVFRTDERQATAVVDGACVFLNRPGFAGGRGCALHHGAIDEGESPVDWKPSICWQLPLRVEEGADGTRTLRRWQRSDWHADHSGSGDGTDHPADAVAWCCSTDRTPIDAYRASTPLVTRHEAELRALLGPETYVELRRATQR
ncbi:MAG: hypothetical protein AAF467_26960 [Actinomycetota bacterium]